VQKWLVAGRIVAPVHILVGVMMAEPALEA
jgi:hypothetical protein